MYVNGQPVCARPPNKIGEYAELGAITRDIVKKGELEFLETVKQRLEADGNKLKVVDVNKKQSEIEVKELKSLSEAIEGLKEKFPGLVHMRVPVCNSAAPTEADFDIICKTLVGSSVNTPIIVSDQVMRQYLETLFIWTLYRSASPAPPRSASLSACSRSSSSPPATRASWRLCRGSTRTS